MSALFITPAGVCECLYTEQIDLSAIGRIHVRRATHIIYDNAERHWVVTDTLENKLFSHSKREVCLKWEQGYLEKRETLKHGGEASLRHLKV